MKNLTYALTAVALMASGSAAALDNSRTGLQIGIGASYAQTDVESSSFNNFNTDSAGNIGGVLSLGIGLNNQLALFAGAMATRTSSQGEDNVATIAGLGATFYLSGRAASLYLTGMYGIGFLGSAEEDRFTEDSTNAWMVGAGYEFSPHIHLELNYTSSGSLAVNETTRHRFQAAFATAKYVWY